MSGDKNSTVDDELKKLLEKVDNNYSLAGLKNYIYNPEVENILGLNLDQLRQLTSEACGEYSFVLAQFSLHNQLMMNRTSIVVDWCDNAINRLLSKEYENYGDKFVPYQIKKFKFISQNDLAKRLYEVWKEYSLRKEALNNLNHNIKMMSDTLVELQRSKRKYYAS